MCTHGERRLEGAHVFARAWGPGVVPAGQGECAACLGMELGISFLSAKDGEVDNVSNLSCQPLRVAAPLTCQGGRIS